MQDMLRRVYYVSAACKVGEHPGLTTETRILGRLPMEEEHLMPDGKAGLHAE